MKTNLQLYEMYMYIELLSYNAINMLYLCI